MVSEKTDLLDKLRLMEEHVQFVLSELAPGPARSKTLDILAVTRYLKIRLGSSAVSVWPNPSERRH